MKETEKNECSCSSNGCDCENPIRGKLPKALLCLAVLLAAFSIIAYRTVSASSIGITSSGEIPINSNIQSYGAIRPLNMLNRIPNNTMPVSFTFGQPVSENIAPRGNTILATPNLGEYVESLDELNIVALDSDGVIIFIPASGNVLVDDTTKKAVFEIQRDLKRSKTTIGLYTLWFDSPDYLKIAGQTKLPAIIIARNGKGTVTLSGSNVNTFMLLQSYLKAAVEDCCEYFVPNCCY